MCMNTLVNDLLQLFLRYQEVDLRYKVIITVLSVYIAKVLRNTFIEDETAQCGGNNSCTSSPPTIPVLLTLIGA